MRFDGGWVKLHRSILTSEIGRDGYACWIFLKLVMWANIEDGRIDGKPLLRGQLVTGIREIAEKTEFGIGTVHRKLLKLEKLGMLERKKAYRGSLITIVNYSKYQDFENPPGTQKSSYLERMGNTYGTQAERMGNLNEELNKERNKEGEKETNSCVPPPGDEPEPKAVRAIVPIEDPEVLSVASQWFLLAQQEMPWKQSTGEWCIQGFARSLIKVAKATDLNHAGLAALFKFVESDDFWRKNAISPNGLLTKSKNGSRKIDNILSRMKPSEDKLKKALDDYVKANKPPQDYPF